MTAAHLHLSVTEDAQAPYMKASATPALDQVRRCLAKLTALPSAARVIVFEVCALIELGGKGRCFANNQHFATKACCSIKTVTRQLDLLVKNELLWRSSENNDNAKRELAPTEKLNAILAGKEQLGRDRVSRPSGQGVLTPRDRVSQGSGQGVPHNTVKAEGNKEEGSNNPSVVATVSAAADLKLIASLQQEVATANERLAKAKVEYRKLATEHADLKTTTDQLTDQLAKERKAKRAPKAAASLPERFTDEVSLLNAEELARWGRFCQWEGENSLTRVYALPKPLLPAELFALNAEWGWDKVREILLEMENSGALKGKQSARMTAHNWLSRNKKRELELEERRLTAPRYSQTPR